MHDVGIVNFYSLNGAFVRGCLYIYSSTDLRALETEYELLCRNASGLFSVGYIDYDNYKTKCSEIDGVIAIPTEQYFAHQNASFYVNDTFYLQSYRQFWTGIERTGPFAENFTFTQSLPFNSTCYTGQGFSGDVYATRRTPVVNQTASEYVFTLRNKPHNVEASCVCAEW